MTTPTQVRGRGWRTQMGISDASPNAGINPYLPKTGWDVLFQPDDFKMSEPEFEIYHIALDGPVGSSVSVLVDNHQWDFVNQGWSNGWDPSQPLLIKSGQSLQFCWNVAFTSPPYNKTNNIQPTVTVWVRKPPADLLG